MLSQTTVRLWQQRALRWLPVILWMGLIFYLSHQPDLPSPSSDLLNLLLKKAGHLLMYAGLAALVWRALAREGLSPARRLGLSLLVAVLYGLSDEYHQSFVPGRTCRLADLGIDALGAALALIILQMLRSHTKPRFNSNL